MQFHFINICLKVHVHSLFTLEKHGFPECLLLDTDKPLNQ